MKKYCPMCKKLYMSADDNFYKDKQNADGYKTRCKKCIKNKRIKPRQPSHPLRVNKGGCYGSKKHLQKSIDNMGY